MEQNQLLTPASLPLTGNNLYLIAYVSDGDFPAFDVVRYTYNGLCSLKTKEKVEPSMYLVDKVYNINLFDNKFNDLPVGNNKEMTEYLVSYQSGTIDVIMVDTQGEAYSQITGDSVSLDLYDVSGVYTLPKLD